MFIFFLFVWFGFQILFALLFFFLALAFLTGAPFVPSTKKTAEQMVSLATISSNSVVYDLGSGDGRLLFLAAKRGAKKIVGVEINPYLVYFTKLRIMFSPFRKIISCRWQNFWNTSLRDADVVFVYLLPWKMDKLKEKLQKELKPGAHVVSNSFIFPGWKIIAKDEKNHVYVFTV